MTVEKVQLYHYSEEWYYFFVYIHFEVSRPIEHQYCFVVYWQEHGDIFPDVMCERV